MYLGYLVCEKCGGYYELKKGEALNDFKSCDCGGKLKYVKNLDNELKKMSKCQFCGTENLKNDEFCGSCGKPLNYITEKPPKKISGINSPNQSEKTKKNEIDIIAIVSGLITAIILYFIYFLSIYIIPALFSGIVAGFFTSNESYKKSILYGAITSVVGISICYIIINIIYSSYFSIQYTYIQFQPLSMIEILLLAIILGAIGGFIGSFLKQRIKY